jgi:SPP1 gp7 family putative phage head morphogenesis protein
MSSTIAQIRDIIRIENAAGSRIRKVLGKFQLIALRRFERKLTSIITQKELDEMVRVFGAALAAADHLARKRVRLSLIDDFFDEGGLYQQDALAGISGLVQQVNDDLKVFTQDLINGGLPTRSAKLLLAEKMDNLGLSPRNSFSIENLVRTQTQITYNAAKFEEEQLVDEIWGYKYVTVGDVRVRPEHAVFEGVTLPKDDPFWLKFYPPNGWSCRCQVIPIFGKQKIKKPKGDLEIDPRFAMTPNLLRVS